MTAENDATPAPDEVHLDPLESRLSNWKFNTALLILDNAGVRNRLLPGDADAIEALAQLFGDSGYFDGAVGDLVEYAVGRLLERIAHAKGGT